MFNTCSECDWFEDNKCIYVNSKTVKPDDKSCILFYNQKKDYIKTSSPGF